MKEISKTLMKRSSMKSWMKSTGTQLLKTRKPNLAIDNLHRISSR